MDNLVEALEKATVVASIITDQYTIYDAQNPTEDERTAYRVDCGRIFILFKVLEDYLDLMGGLLSKEVPN
jgi:hypothetical protein